MRTLRKLLVRAALVVFGATPLLGVLAAQASTSSGFASALDTWFELHCRRDPARMLGVFGASLPVCARCFGVYAGLMLGAVLERPRLSQLGLCVWFGLAALVMGLDVATEVLHMRPPYATLRWATGFFLAYPAAAALVRSLDARETYRPYTTPSDG